MNKIAYGFLGALATMLGCSAARSPDAGSQTHFLESCSASCAAPYSCICGACSLACDADKSCGSHAASASCVQAIERDGRICKSAEQVCDVECTGDAECRTLGGSFVCESGRCRMRATSGSDAGSGGGGSGGQAGTNGGSGGRDGSGGRIVVGVAGSAGVSGAGGSAGVSGAAGGAGCGASSCPTPIPLCDGSDDLRIAVTTGPGFSDSIVQFTNPHGSFFTVDGKCHYYAMGNYMNGLFEGTLSESDAAQLASDLHFATFADIAGYEPPQCADGGSIVITVRGARAQCDCGMCGKTAPPARQPALDAASTWIMKLTTQGPPNQFGPVSALARPEGTPAPQNAPEPATWGLDRAMTDIPNLIVPLDHYVERTSGVRFDATKDSDRLRSLRIVFAAMNAPPAYAVRVQDKNSIYNLYVRDELPDAVENALNDLIASAPVR